MPVFEITTPDGRTFDVEGPDAQGALAALTKAIGQSDTSSKQEMVGFGTRADREQDMPESPELQKEIAIAKRMAQQREGSSFQQESPILGHLPDFLNPTVVSGKDVFSQNYTFGLRDEVGAAASGIGNMLRGGSYSDGYEISKEADRRLREEYAKKNPGANAAATVAGLVTGGMGAATEKALTATAGQAAPTLLQQMGQGAKAAGIQGAVQGAAEGDETEDGRLLGAVQGGAIGAAIGGAAPALIEGVKVAARPVTNTVRAALRPEQEAAKRITEARAKDFARGDGLDDAAYDAARAAGQPVTLMDRGGETTRALARSAANQSPEARAAMEEVVRPRFATQVERIDDVLRSESKLPAGDFLEQAEMAARSANRPKYAQAYKLGSGDVWDEKLERLLQAPAVERAMKTALSKYKDKAILEGFGGLNSRISLDEAGNLLFRNEGGLQVRPDLRLWDLTKRELDGMASVAKRSGDPTAADYSGLAKELRNHLDTLGEMGRAYKAARDTAASFFGAENAYEAGLKYAGSKGSSAREAIRGLSKLKPQERELFREGYVQAMRDRMSELKTNRDATLSIMNSKGDLERARVALGKDGAQRLQAQLEVEVTMDAVRKAFGNSTTARQLTELGLASAAGSGSMAATGNTDPTSLTAGALAGIATRWGRGKIDARLSQQIGKMLASSDPKQVEALVKLASRSPKYLEAMRVLRSQIVGAGARAIAAP